MSNKNKNNPINYFDDEDDDFSVIFQKKPNSNPPQNQPNQNKPPIHSTNKINPNQSQIKPSTQNNQTNQISSPQIQSKPISSPQNQQIQNKPLNQSNNQINQNTSNSTNQIKAPNKSIFDDIFEPEYEKKEITLEKEDVEEEEVKMTNSFSNNVLRVNTESIAPSEDFEVNPRKQREPQINQDDEIIKKLLEEKNQLLLELETLKSSYTPSSAIKCLIKGHHVDLTIFKSIQKKEELLNLAIASLDDDVLLQIIVFIRDTLKQDLFIELIGKYKAASHHYICFLESNEQYKEMAFIYKALKQPKEEGYAMMSFANIQKDPSKKLQALTYAMNHFSSLQDCQFVHQQLKLQIDLLKRQMTIDEFDDKCQKRGDQIYVKFPRKNLGFSLVGATLNQTLYYCLFYHPVATIDKLSSPLALQKQFEIPENMYAWTKLNARSKIGDWDSLLTILIEKGVFNKTLHSPIGFEPFLLVLSQCRAPLNVQHYYAKLVSDPEERYALSLKYKLHDVVIDSLVELQDKERLLSYKETVISRMDPLTQPGTTLHAKINKILKNPTMKWK